MRVNVNPLIEIAVGATVYALVGVYGDSLQSVYKVVVLAGQIAGIVSCVIGTAGIIQKRASNWFKSEVVSPMGDEIRKAIRDGVGPVATSVELQTFTIGRLVAGKPVAEMAKEIENTQRELETLRAALNRSKLKV